MGEEWERYYFPVRVAINGVSGVIFGGRDKESQTGKQLSDISKHMIHRTN